MSIVGLDWDGLVMDGLDWDGLLMAMFFVGLALVLVLQRVGPVGVNPYHPQVLERVLVLQRVGPVGEIPSDPQVSKGLVLRLTRNSGI